MTDILKRKHHLIHSQKLETFYLQPQRFIIQNYQGS